MMCNEIFLTITNLIILLIQRKFFPSHIYLSTYINHVPYISICYSLSVSLLYYCISDQILYQSMIISLMPIFISLMCLNNLVKNKIIYLLSIIAIIFNNWFFYYNLDINKIYLGLGISLYSILTVINNYYIEKYINKNLIEYYEIQPKYNFYRIIIYLNTLKHVISIPLFLLSLLIMILITTHMDYIQSSILIVTTFNKIISDKLIIYICLFNLLLEYLDLIVLHYVNFYYSYILKYIFVLSLYNIYYLYYNSFNIIHLLSSIISIIIGCVIFTLFIKILYNKSLLIYN